MAERELRRLSRQDLVEIIYELRKHEEALQEENEALRKQLEDKRLKISKAGSLAELSADLNGLFDSAQATANQYLHEIKAARDRAEQVRSETERKAAALTRKTLKERKQMLEQTEAECRRMREEVAAGRRTASSANQYAPSGEPLVPDIPESGGTG